MTVWKITLSYDGSSFHGWQVQPGRPTVQGALAAALHRITGETVLPQGSGRTDAGVHALAQVASVVLAALIPAGNLQRALNRALPPSIRVLAAEPAAADFHARHSALRKTYEYRVFEAREPRPGESRELKPELLRAGDARICSPFLAPYAWDCRWNLALEPMQRAAALLLGTHDFTSFTASDPELSQRMEDGSAPNPIKTIYASAVLRTPDLLLYRITGSGFLHHMVRNVVGTLVEVGRGARTASDIPTILAARDRAAAGPTAPPQGLFLVSVEYPEQQPPASPRPPA